MSDWFESLKAVVTERVSSPLVFAYALAWPIINYQIVLMVFSDAKVLDKIAFISAQYGEWQGQVYYLGWPLVVAFVYMLGMPWVSHVNLAYTFWQGRFTREMRLKHENATMISKSERDELVTRHREELDRLHTELSRKAATYADLGRENENLLRMHSDSEQKITSLEQAKSELENANIQLQEECHIHKAALEDMKQATKVERQFYTDFDEMLPGLKIIADNNTVSGSQKDIDLAMKAKRFVDNLHAFSRIASMVDTQVPKLR